MRIHSYLIIISIILLTSCERVKPVEPVAKNDMEVSYNGDGVFLYQKTGINLEVNTSIAQRQMQLVMESDAFGRDTVYFSSADTTINITLPIEDSALSQMCLDAALISVSGHLTDCQSGDTISFTKDIRCMPKIRVIRSEMKYELDKDQVLVGRTTPLDAMSDFNIESVPEFLSRAQLTENGNWLNVHVTPSMIGSGEIIFTYSKYPDYKYRVPVSVYGNYDITTGFVEVEETIEGKVFTHLKPVVYITPQAEEMSEGFPNAGIGMYLRINAKGHCNWYDDSNWDDPEVKEKLSIGYHITRSDEFEYCDTLYVDGLQCKSANFIDRRKVYDIDLAEIIFRYQSHIEFLGTETDPISHATYPVYQTPAPRHYYECDVFELSFIPDIPGNHIRFASISEQNRGQYQKTMTNILVQKSRLELEQEGITDESGSKALLTWGTKMSLTIGNTKESAE